MRSTWIISRKPRARGPLRSRRALPCAGLIATIVLSALTAGAAAEPDFAAIEQALERAERMRFEAELEREAVDHLLNDTAAMIETAEADLANLEQQRDTRIQAARLAFLKGELRRRIALLLPPDDPARAAQLERSITIFQDMRVDYRDLSIGELGYIGESRARRAAGDRQRAEDVLAPLLETRRRGDAAAQSIAGLAELERIELLLRASPADAIQAARKLQRQPAVRRNANLLGGAKWLESKAMAERGEPGDADAIFALLRDDQTRSAAHAYERLAMMAQLDRKLMTSAERLTWANELASLGHTAKAVEVFAEIDRVDATAFSAQDRRTLGMLLWRQRSFTAAAAAFERALDHDDLDPAQRHTLLQWRAMAIQRARADHGNDQLAQREAQAWWDLLTTDADPVVRAEALHNWIRLRRDTTAAPELLTILDDHDALVRRLPRLAYAKHALRWRAWHDARSRGQQSDEASLGELRDLTAALVRTEEAALAADDEATTARAALLRAIVHLTSPLSDAAEAEAALRSRWPLLQRSAAMAPTAIRWRATALLELGRTDAAADLLRDLEGTPAPADALLALADALADRYPAATASQQEALQQRVRNLVDRTAADNGVDPGRAARLLLAVESYPEAVRLLTSALESPSSERAPSAQRVEMLVLLGRAQRMARQYDAAIATLEQAVADHAEAGSLHLELGLTWRALGDAADALASLRAARSRFATGGRRWWQATLALTETLAESDQPQHARDLLRAATTLYPPPDRPTLQQRIRSVEDQLHAHDSDDTETAHEPTR